ncbi:hypothetical protein Celaphus_00019291, partial [Cervus elaphus hippelaphus]
MFRREKEWHLECQHWSQGIASSSTNNQRINSIRSNRTSPRDQTHNTGDHELPGNRQQTNNHLLAWKLRQNETGSRILTGRYQPSVESTKKSHSSVIADLKKLNKLLVISNTAWILQAGFPLQEALKALHLVGRNANLPFLVSRAKN